MGIVYVPTPHPGSVANVLAKFSAVDLIWIVPIVLLYLWFVTTGTKSESFFLFATIVVSLVISYLMGVLYSHPAPYMVHAHTLLSGPPENSFPSQHTTVVFAMAWPLFWLKRRRAGLLAVGLALLVGASRVYVGVHFPIDIAGSLLASLVGFGVIYLASSPIEVLAAQCIRIEHGFWTVVRSR